MSTVWLVLLVVIAGHEPIVTANDKRPSIEVCLAEAGKFLKTAPIDKLPEGSEVVASCSVVSGDEDPA